VTAGARIRSRAAQPSIEFVTPTSISDNVEKEAKGLSRRALEGLALEELRAGRITEPQLRKMLGLTRIQLDGFLKSHGIYRDYTLEDFERERKSLKDLGF
jgi:hypothetical protein